MEMQRRDDLECDVLNLTYDFGTRVGTLYMPDFNCCDMSGCIALFEAIDENVKQINTRAGDEPDTVYALIGGRWCAGGPRPIAPHK